MLHNPHEVQSMRRPLSQRETEILYLLYTDQSCKEIGAKLDLSSSTVKTHVANIANKLGLRGQRLSIMAMRIQELTEALAYLKDKP